MSSRYEVELKFTSATDIKNVNWRHGPTRPYAVVWADPTRKCSSRSDDLNDTNPIWDETLLIPLPSSTIDDQTALFIDLVHAGSEPDTKRLIGSARLNLRELVDHVGLGQRATRTLPIIRPSGRPHGRLDVAVSVRDPYGASPPHGGRPLDPYYAPPAAPAPYGASAPHGGRPLDPYYAPPAAPASYGFSGDPYGRAPAYSGGEGSYGQVEGEKKKSKFGGMGTGLAIGAVAGVVGGVALMEGAEYLEDKIADDVAEKVEDDLGFDDADDF